MRWPTFQCTSLGPQVGGSICVGRYCDCHGRTWINIDHTYHTPPPPLFLSGLTEYISTMLRVSNTYLEIDIVVHEFTMQAVTPEAAHPRCVNE